VGICTLRGFGAMIEVKQKFKGVSDYCFEERDLNGHTAVRKSFFEEIQTT
jgi:hypothetical protein